MEERHGGREAKKGRKAPFQGLVLWGGGTQGVALGFCRAALRAFEDGTGVRRMADGGWRKVEGEWWTGNGGWGG